MDTAVHYLSILFCFMTVVKISSVNRGQISVLDSSYYNIEYAHRSHNTDNTEYSHRSCNTDNT